MYEFGRNVTNLEIPELYTLTDKGDLFLLYDSGIQSENQRILIFGSDRDLEMLSTSRVWLADGTFKTVPGLFYFHIPKLKDAFFIYVRMCGENIAIWFSSKI